MANFTGQLNANEIFGALYNMIISQEIYTDNIEGDDLVDKAKVDGSLYGDTKLYYSTDALYSSAWGNDAEATNLLAVNRPKAPETQAIVLDVFRQIEVTVDNYLSKRAWTDEGAFATFNSVMLGWLNDTKKIYDGTTYNVFMGTNVSSASINTIEVDLNADGNSAGENLGLAIANLYSALNNYSRKYNDYGHIRKYSKARIKVLWNSKYLNTVKKIDLPSIFHNEELEKSFVGDDMVEDYWGTVITSSNISTYSASTPTTGKPINSGTGAYTPGTNNANGCLRAVYEKTVTVGGTAYHMFAGEEIPAGATVKAGGDFLPGEVYIQQEEFIAKVYIKLPPYMSAFQVGTSFFNAKALNENHYLTFGHNTLEHLKNYPFITLKVKSS